MTEWCHTDDLYLNQTKEPNDTWQPSAITKINGTDAIEYLSHFAALNSRGTLEPHADWNTLMDSPVLDVLQQTSTWDGAATFYPGDQFSYDFENGTSLDDEWLAVYYSTGGTGPLETGGDFYNFFVLGFYPASYEPPNTTTADDSSDVSNNDPITSLNYYTIAYPDTPDVYQENLTTDGFVTGYFFPSSSLAVLSIPTFYADEAAIGSFSNTVQSFLTQSKTKGLQKILIDLQQNSGGDIILAYNTFKQFFPSIDPFAGSAMRNHPLADTMGEIITAYYDSLDTTDEDYLVAAIEEWTATSRLNALTGQNFSSWEEFFGPNPDAIDLTFAERLNTDSYLFDYAALGSEEPPEPLFRDTGPDVYAASDIVIVCFPKSPNGGRRPILLLCTDRLMPQLSDALCSSACSLFMEMMRHDAGVKNVVIGGRPSYGPMQTPSGSRGARYYDVTELDTDIDNAMAIQNSTDNLPNRYDQSIFINSGGVSLREQVIRGNENTPLSMQYEAAECRIFLTPSTFNNFTNLWQYAADALWTNPSLCVANSTGYSPITSPAPPPVSSTPPGVTYDTDGLLSFDGPSTINPLLSSPNSNDPLPDAIIPTFLVTRPHFETVEFTNVRADNIGPRPNGPPRPPQPPRVNRNVNRPKPAQKNFCSVRAPEYCHSSSSGARRRGLRRVRKSR